MNVFGKGKAAPRGSTGRWRTFSACLLVSIASLRAQDASPAPTPDRPRQAPRSVVYEIHDPASIDHFAVDRGRVHSMVDRLVLNVTGRDTLPAAWRALVEPNDVVGIKISAAGGAVGATHHAVIDAIVDGLLSAGVSRDRVFVWDRDAADLRAAGYLGPHNQQIFSCPVRWIEPRWGYDASVTYSSSLLGKLIWGDYSFRGRPLDADEPHPFIQPTPTPHAGPTSTARARSLEPDQNLSNLSHYATILTGHLTKIIDVPVFADNEFAGLGGALYNVTIPDVDNWRRLVSEPQYGATAIPELFSDPTIGGRVALCLTDGLIAQIAGAPEFQPLYARDHATLYASRDAVALDAVVLRQLEAWRAQAQLPAAGETFAHVKVCGDLALGNFAADKIDVRRLGN